MFRIDNTTSAAAAPAVPAADTEGFFTSGNPVSGIPATVIPDWWLNMIQEEIRAVVVAAGLTPSKTTLTQLRDGLAVLYGGGGSVAMPGWQKLPGGLIIQWGDAANAASVVMPVAFPTRGFVVLCGDADNDPAVGAADFATAGPNVTTINFYGVDVNYWIALGH